MILKESWKWSEDDLLRLIEVGAQESLELDYKQCDALQKNDKKKNELSKDVSAFANSAGGTIVYGIVENGRFPAKIDCGYDPEEISKEWIEQVINSRIQRRITGIRINQVELARTHPGRVAYVIHIPQSDHAPHQAADKRFYKRFNFESVPMEEYEIRDVSGRAKGPDLKVEFNFLPGGKSTALESMDLEYFRPVRLSACISNMSSEPAAHAVFHFYFDGRLRIDEVPSEFNPSGDEKFDFKLSEALVMNKYTTLWDTKRGLPLFSTITAQLPAEALNLYIPRRTDWLLLRHQAGAPGMTPIDGLTILTVKDGRAYLDKYEVGSAQS